MKAQKLAYFKSSSFEIKNKAVAVSTRDCRLARILGTAVSINDRFSDGSAGNII